MKAISNYFIWLGLSIILISFSLAMWYQWSNALKESQMLIYQKNDLETLRSTLENVCDNSIGTKICVSFRYTKFLEYLNISGTNLCYQLGDNKKVCSALTCKVKNNFSLKKSDPIVKPLISNNDFASLNICIEKSDVDSINITFSLTRTQ